MNEHVWPCINYADAHAAIDFLKRAFGFEATLVVPGDDHRPVPHAELRTPWGGGVMVGSATTRTGEADDVHAAFSSMPTGAASVYVVVDDPDALYERATGAGCEVVQPIGDETDYDQRGFTVRDVEGNLWSFGTYPGAP